MAAWQAVGGCREERMRSCFLWCERSASECAPATVRLSFCSIVTTSSRSRVSQMRINARPTTYSRRGIEGISFKKADATHARGALGVEAQSARAPQRACAAAAPIDRSVDRGCLTHGKGLPCPSSALYAPPAVAVRELRGWRKGPGHQTALRVCSAAQRSRRKPHQAVSFCRRPKPLCNCIQPKHNAPSNPKLV